MERQVFWLFTSLNTICRYLRTDKEAKKLLPISLGLLSCLYGCRRAVSGLPTNECKLFLKRKSERSSWTIEHLIQGFSCSKCDKKFIRNHNEWHPPIIVRSDMCGADAQVSLDSSFMQLQSLFFSLLFDESSEDVQITCESYSSHPCTWCPRYSAQ
jgi:serine/threonine-protein kinase ATR